MQNEYEFLSMLRLGGVNNMHYRFEADVFLLIILDLNFITYKTVKTLIRKGIVEAEVFYKG